MQSPVSCNLLSEIHVDFMFPLDETCIINIDNCSLSLSFSLSLSTPTSGHFKQNIMILEDRKMLVQDLIIHKSLLKEIFLFLNEEMKKLTFSSLKFHLVCCFAAYSHRIYIQVSSGDRDQRMKEALGTMGASVFRFSFSLLTGYIMVHGSTFLLLDVKCSFFGYPRSNALYIKKELQLYEWRGKNNNNCLLPEPKDYFLSS